MQALQAVAQQARRPPIILPHPLPRSPPRHMVRAVHPRPSASCSCHLLVPTFKSMSDRAVCLSMTRLPWLMYCVELHGHARQPMKQRPHCGLRRVCCAQDPVHDEGTQAFGALDESVQAEPPLEPEPAWEEQPQAVPQYTLHNDATRTGLLQDVRAALGAWLHVEQHSQCLSAVRTRAVPMCM